MARSAHYWTADKLDFLESYIPAFVHATKKASKRYYVDGFAGPGSNLIDGKERDGSPLIALNASEACTHYFLVERKRDLYKQLSSRINEHIRVKLVNLKRGNFNELVDDIFQILTKRHERLVELAPLLPWPDNVWMGISVENQKYVHRVDYLRQVPAKVRFLSCEPLLGPLELNLTDIHWVITGGESGPKHRPVKEEWVRSIRDQCQKAEVSFFHKQWGGTRPKSNGRMLDGRTWDDFPAIQTRVV